MPATPRTDRGVGTDGASPGLATDGKRRPAVLVHSYNLWIPALADYRRKSHIDALFDPRNWCIWLLLLLLLLLAILALLLALFLTPPKVKTELLHLVRTPPFVAPALHPLACLLPHPTRPSPNPRTITLPRPRRSPRPPRCSAPRGGVRTWECQWLT